MVGVLTYSHYSEMIIKEELMKKVIVSVAIFILSTSLGYASDYSYGSPSSLTDGATSSASDVVTEFNSIATASATKADKSGYTATGAITFDGVDPDIITVSNQDITLTPNGTGDVGLSADTVTVGDSGAAVTVTSNGAGALSIITGSTNADIDVTPNGTGDVTIGSDTVIVGDAGAGVNLTTNGADDLTINTNSGTSSPDIVITSGANANIEIAPSGTGDTLLTSDTVRIGDAAAAATLTTNGAGNLTINTNSGTSTPDIVLTTGANNDITLAPSGTGNLIVTADELQFDDTAPTISTDSSNKDITIAPHGTGNMVITTDTLSFNDGELIIINSSEASDIVFQITDTGTPTNMLRIDGAGVINVEDAISLNFDHDNDGFPYIVNDPDGSREAIRLVSSNTGSNAMFQIYSTTNQRFYFDANGEAYADNAGGGSGWNTFSPDITKHMKKKGKKKKDATSDDYLEWVLEDAKKPHKPYNGVGEGIDSIQARIDSAEDDVLRIELIEKINSVRALKEKYPSLSVKEAEHKEYAKGLDKIAIGTAIWAEEAQKVIEQLEARIQTLENQ